MNNFFSDNICRIVPIYVISAFLYIVFVIQPELIFHHIQPPFILSPVFYKPYLNYPGGPAELIANLIMQSFYFQIIGPLVLLTVAFSIGLLIYELINSNYKSKLNIIWASIPFFLTLILTNNYNFPFAAVVSVGFILSMLFILSKTGKHILISILIYASGSVFIYWFSGSGYMIVFSVAALFVSMPIKPWSKVVYIVFVVAFAFLFPLLASNVLFPSSLKHRYFMFFAPKAWFMKYEPSMVFLLYLTSIPALLLITNFFSVFRKTGKSVKSKKEWFLAKLSFAVVVVSILFITSHIYTFDSDAKKIVKADYFCYLNNAEKTAINASTLKEYNFAANLNYNLVMSKTGRLTEKFFCFMQIKGIESLHPDVEFASEYSFIASDFYYNLGFITEARHWAYETLVFYPYSLRAMQNLVKIHLVTGEYEAAERTLNTLKKGLTGRGFVSKYMPYVEDTSLVSSNAELMEKRSFIPVEKELNTTIEGRFSELLDANNSNKVAYEYIMLYYLANAQLEKFEVLFNDASRYFDKTPDIYEEALLMHSARSGKTHPSNVIISGETQNRYNNFIKELEKYRGKTRLARNALYAEYGKTYLYFLKFVYPNILEPVIVNDEDDYPEI